METAILVRLSVTATKPADMRGQPNGMYRYMGLTGFDSGMKWYVSMRSVDGLLLNLSYQKFNWRKQLRSRCLIEVQ